MDPSPVMSQDDTLALADTLIASLWETEAEDPTKQSTDSRPTETTKI